MARTRGQQRAEAAAVFNMTTLPDDLLVRVLNHVMWRRRSTPGVPVLLDQDEDDHEDEDEDDHEDEAELWVKSVAVRGVSRKWRAIHDAACPSLRLHNGMTDKVMRALCGRLHALTHLTLMVPSGQYNDAFTSLTAAGLCAVGGLTTLTKLFLHRCNVTDVVLRELRGLTALTDLCIASPIPSPSRRGYAIRNVTDEGMRELRHLPALTKLSLLGCEYLTGVGLGELRGLIKLELFRCLELTDLGLKHLTSTPALTDLYLNGCSKVTDAGLRHLTSITTLTVLVLHRTSTSQAGRTDLRAALPALEVVYTNHDEGYFD